MSISDNNIIADSSGFGETAFSPRVMAMKQRFGIVGNSPLLMQAIERAVRVGPVDLSVLITGESGTGKEFFPRIIHQESVRRHGRYIAVNCGAIPEGTIDSELFGHEKGSFTGAIATRKGYFEEADGGTIFLDEVAELPLTTQARLLRVLETGEFLKVGSSTVQTTNVRIVAATNVDLVNAIAEGRFREDLYYRLSTVVINVPPLRMRGNDIELLARRFAADFADKYRTPLPTLDAEARRLLLNYSWPGNVRQLKNVIEQISLFDGGKEVNAETLENYLVPLRNEESRSENSHVAAVSSYERERDMLFNMIFSLRSRVEHLAAEVNRLSGSESDDVETQKPVMSHERLLPAAGARKPEGEDVETKGRDEERRAISEALERHDGRRRAAAKDLNITERMLYKKIKEYGLE